MRTNGYSISEIEILNKNPNVVMVKYGKQIEYKDSFKKWAVLQSLSHPELSAIQIFELAGFDKKIIGSRVADSRIRYWKGNYIRYKKDYFNYNSNANNHSVEEKKTMHMFTLLSSLII
jgi:hypothetical protein